MAAGCSTAGAGLSVWLAELPVASLLTLLAVELSCAAGPGFAWLSCVVGVGAAVLVDRANGKLDLGVPLVSALAVEVQSWEADALPDWLAAIPVTRPGSTGKK